MSETIHRAEFLRRGAAAAAGLAAAGTLPAVARASRLASTSVTAANLGTLNMQLNWIKNFEFAGSYIADHEGLYKHEGFSKVNLLSGGPSVTVEPLVVSGKATMAYGVTETTAAAINKGAPLKIIGAGFQKNPLGIMSLAKNPIHTPHDLIGKKIGVQSFEQPIWESFLKINKIAPSSLKTVPVQFDPAPLVSGQVDGFLSFITNEPVDLQHKGIKVAFLLFADYGFDLFEQIYMVDETTLANHRDVVTAALRAEIRGWRRNIANPALGAKLGVDIYGKGLKLNYPTELDGNRAQIKLMVSPTTQKHGIFWMDPAEVQKVRKTLASLGSPIPTTAFTNEILADIYKHGTTI